MSKEVLKQFINLTSQFMKSYGSTEKNSDEHNMDNFARFIGFFMAHMVWQLQLGDTLMPRISVQSSNERKIKLVGVDDLPYEYVMAIAREGIDCIISSSRVDKQTRIALRSPDGPDAYDLPHTPSIIVSREELKPIISFARSADYVLLTWDGFLTKNNRRDEAIFIEAYDIRHSKGTMILVVIPYRSARSKEGVAVYQPQLELVDRPENLPDTNDFFNNAYEGAQSHTEAFKFWEKYVDISCKVKNL